LVIWEIKSKNPNIKRQYEKENKNWRGNDPYHKAVTNEQNSLTRGLAPKQSKTINWPMFEDDLYPPKPFKRREE